MPSSAANQGRKVILQIQRLFGQTPPWLISVVIHAVPMLILSMVAMGSGTQSEKILTIDTRMDDELITDTFTQQLSDFQALPENTTYLALSGSTSASGGGGGGGSGGGSGGSGGGSGGGFGGGGASGIPADPGRMTAVKVPSYLVGLGGSGMPGKLSMDRPMGLGSGGLKGEVDAHADSTAAAMDRITREILRLLQSKKVLVIWMFDESLSMKDDQQDVNQRFDRVYEDLGITRPDAGDAVETVITSFGKQTHFLTGDKPTHDLKKIREAIEKIPVEESGAENTHQAVTDVLAKYYRYFTTGGRWIVLCLVTDESGDDGGKVEETLQVAKRYKTPIFIVGRQSMFGKKLAILTWTDPETGATYWPTITRGPESADVELLQFDGLHGRNDNQVSGFGPYELARLARDSGGIYFMLPGEEQYGLGTAKQYDYLALKQYVPEYISRKEYFDQRQASEFRRTLYQIIEETRPEKIAVPGGISGVDLPRVVEQARAADQKAAASLKMLENVEQIVLKMRTMRDKEANRRWQADYDLIAGQIPAYQVMLVEYRLLMQEIMANPPKPTPPTNPKLPPTGWWLGHGGERRIEKAKDKKLIDAMRSKEENARSLLAKVVEDHPATPWADRATWELTRGWGAHVAQHNLHPSYYSRASMVPKF